MADLHLVCLREPNSRIMEKISEVFGDDQHFVLNDTQVVVAKPANGGKSVYERIKEEINDDFVALIVRFRHFHGRHNSSLWPWLAKHVDK